MSSCDCRDDYLPTPPPCPDIPLPPPRPLPPMPGCRPCPPPQDCSNHTPNYGLPLWKASDVTSWLMQMNGAMLRIDTIMHDLALRTGINGLPDDLVSSVSKLIQDMGQVQCQIGELSNKAANNELLMQNINTSFSAMKTDVASVQLSLTNFDTRLMTVDSANQANKNDITLLKTDLNMLSSTVNALQKNFQQYQQATNQTLATLQAGQTEANESIENIEKEVEELKEGRNPGYDVYYITENDLEILDGNGDPYTTMKVNRWRENGIVAVRKDGIIIIQHPRFDLGKADESGAEITNVGWVWVDYKPLTQKKKDENWNCPCYSSGLCTLEDGTVHRFDCCSTSISGTPIFGAHIQLTNVSSADSHILAVTGSTMILRPEWQAAVPAPTSDEVEVE